MNEIKNIIDGVKIIKKKQIIDDRGKILHMLRADDDNFIKSVGLSSDNTAESFGEIMVSISPSQENSFVFTFLSNTPSIYDFVFP